jgi:hypothetical protein
MIAKVINSSSYQCYSITTNGSSSGLRMTGGSKQAEDAQGSQCFSNHFRNVRCFFAREVALATRAKPTGSNKISVFPQRRSRTDRLEVRAGEREIFSSHKSPAHVPSHCG